MFVCPRFHYKQKGFFFFLVFRYVLYIYTIFQKYDDEESKKKEYKLNIKTAMNGEKSEAANVV